MLHIKFNLDKSSSNLILKESQFPFQICFLFFHHTIIKLKCWFQWCKLRESLSSISESLIKVKGNRDNVDENEPSDCNVPGSSSNTDDVNKEDDIEIEHDSCNDCYSRCKYEYLRPDYCRDKTNLKKMTVIGGMFIYRCIFVLMNFKYHNNLPTLRKSILIHPIY